MFLHRVVLVDYSSDSECEEVPLTQVAKGPYLEVGGANVGNIIPMLSKNDAEKGLLQNSHPPVSKVTP